MKEPFDLEWLGGTAEKYFRKLRPGVDEFPWGTLKPQAYPPLLVDRARVSWTEAAFNEYCTAAAFATLLRTLLEAKSPVDLVGMASDFVADEILHVELTSRVAMELGGGAPYRIDFGRLTTDPSSDLTPLQRANEGVVRLCCVGESFSVPMLSGSMKSASHPLTHAVLERIVQDEAPHGRLGWLYLEWVSDLIDDAERARLAGIAMSALRRYEPFWKRLRSKVVDGVTSEGFRLEDVRQLGWMESAAYARAAREAVREAVVQPLARFGIELPSAEVDRLLASEA